MSRYAAVMNVGFVVTGDKPSCVLGENHNVYVETDLLGKASLFRTSKHLVWPIHRTVMHKIMSRRCASMMN